MEQDDLRRRCQVGEPIGLDEAAVLAISASRGMSLSPEHVAGVVSFNDALRDDLARLRAMPLPYTGAVPLPSDALTWIENGGRRSSCADEATAITRGLPDE